MRVCTQYRYIYKIGLSQDSYKAKRQRETKQSLQDLKAAVKLNEEREALAIQEEKARQEAAAAKEGLIAKGRLTQKSSPTSVSNTAVAPPVVQQQVGAIDIYVYL